jgi:hypothetical protein
MRNFHRQTNCLSLFFIHHYLPTYGDADFFPFGNLRSRAFTDTNWLIKLHCLKFNSYGKFFYGSFFSVCTAHTEKCVFDDDMRFDFLFQQVNDDDQKQAGCESIDESISAPLI